MVVYLMLTNFSYYGNYSIVSFGKTNTTILMLIHCPFYRKMFIEIENQHYVTPLYLAKRKKIERKKSKQVKQ